MPRKKTLVSKHMPKPQTSARRWLEEQTTKELINFILEVAQEHPRISELLADRANLKQGKIGPVREASRKDIEALEPDWQVVSETLEKRLDAQLVPRANASLSGRHKRESLARWLQTAPDRVAASPTSFNYYWEIKGHKT